MGGIITEEELRSNAAKSQGGGWDAETLKAMQAQWCQGQTAQGNQARNEIGDRFRGIRWKYCAYDGARLQSDWKNCPHCGAMIPITITASFIPGLTGGLTANPLGGNDAAWTAEAGYRAASK